MAAEHEIEVAQQAQAAIAHDRQEEILTVWSAMRRKWLELAGLLYDFTKRRQYRDLGYHTFDEWLAAVDMDIGRRQIFKLIEIYETLVVERNLSVDELEGVQISKAYTVLNAVRNDQVEVDQALADARVLPVEDLKIRYKPRPASDKTIEEPLDAEAEPPYQFAGNPPAPPRERRVCETCGQELAA